MSSRIIINVADPAIVPDTGGSTPETGMFSIGESGINASFSNLGLIIGVSAVALFAVIALIIILVRHYKKQQGFKSFIKLYSAHTLSLKLPILTLCIFMSVFAFLKLSNYYHAANAESEPENDGSISISTEDVGINVDLEDEPVFAVGRSTVTVNTATTSGYTLMAFIDNDEKNLVNSTNPESTTSIDMIDVAYPQALTDNTWGVALSSPTSQDNPIFRGLPTTQDDALVIKATNIIPTVANDKITLYYATYVTPELDTGVYTGATITYIALANSTPEDVTVNYHGNGLYFDENETITTNTVIYGETCAMAYVGGNCTKAYIATSPTIVKTENINDDGTMDHYNDSNDRQIQTITKPGADLLQVELTYGYDAADGMLVFIGIPDDYDEVWEYMDDETFFTEFYDYDGSWSDDEQTATINFTVPSDTLTFMIYTGEEPPTYYGYYAKITPIYYEQPQDIDVVEDVLCHIVKSENIDDEGNMIESYTAEYVWQSVVVPGASKVKVDITYAITANTAGIDIAEGHWDGNWGNLPANYYELYSEDENLSGTKSLIFNGDTVSFVMEAWDDPIEDFDYGFYAKIYPIYDEYSEDTTLAEVCSFGQKGTYKEPIGYNTWYTMALEEGGDPIPFYGSADITQFIAYYYEELKGQTLDIYASNYYTIHYDANGGEGTMYDDQIWLPGGGYALSNNSFTRTHYTFNGWNTKPDGSGIAYADGAIIENNLASGGETITLYAQWLAPYTIIFDANGGTGEMNDYIALTNENETLPTNTYTNNELFFSGWNTEPDGTGASYADTAEVRNLIESSETIVLYAQWITCLPNKICYFANANDTEGVMDAYQNIETEVTLWPSNFSRDGYGFAGWSTTPDYSDPDGFYGPQETISLSTTDYTNEGLPLYAHWVLAEEGITMQTFNPNNSPYSTMDNGTVIALKDARDDDVYAVAKLADGNWWMIENLRLDNTAAHNSDGALAQGYASNFVGLADPEFSFVTTHLTNTLYSTDGSTVNTISGSNLANRIPRYNNQNTSSRVQINYTDSSQVYSYGNYYNWAAGMANTTDYAGPTTQVDGYTSDTVNTSICPSGWRLPYGGYSDIPGGFYHLMLEELDLESIASSYWYSDSQFRKYPNNFLYSGHFYDKWSDSRRGNSGGYLSSTSRDNTYAYMYKLSISGGVDIESMAKRSGGEAIRCVASPVSIE